MAQPINMWADSRNARIGDHANFSAVGGNQITNNNTGSGAQNNNNATGMQNVNYGRDQNLNHGGGPMTVNNRGGWTPPASQAYRPAFAPTGSGYQNNNSGEGTQNVNAGRDQNANYGNGGFSINNDERSRRGSPSPVQSTFGGSEGRGQREYAQSPRPSVGIPVARPSSGKPLKPKELARKENAFKQLLEDREQYDDVVGLEGDEAQDVLDQWQRLSECTTDADLRSNIVKASIQLSDYSGLSPHCLQIDGVEDLGDGPVEYGGFADIWKGRIGDVKVAVKVVRHRLDSQKHDRMIKAFTREAMIWRNLNHPNILPFTGMYWFNEAQGQLCLVSPWMENGNLLQFLTNNSDVDHTTQQQLAKNVAQGLAYLHDLQITHGDLKGANVLITPGPIACITDFGLSQVIDSQRLAGLSNTSGRQGPARWLAPELLKSGKRAAMCPESDIYAFGCVCYEVSFTVVTLFCATDH
ncbi:Rho guanine nucleotide exchange factor [Marasmius tenuissimus]|uniref:Rho guanine nucleotide exchange factor n=1 Tax=Marasmius tenuissimus TaxID=585030 RepID=A0ABR2ZYG8_9AGAR